MLNACHVLLAAPPSGQDGHHGLPICHACAAGAVLLLQPPSSHAVSLHGIVCSIGEDDHGYKHGKKPGAAASMHNAMP